MFTLLFNQGYCAFATLSICDVWYYLNVNAYSIDLIYASKNWLFDIWIELIFIINLEYKLLLIKKIKLKM